MENCEFAGEITATGTTANYIGGLIGGFNNNVTGTSTIKNGKVSGNVVAANNAVGGITGRVIGAAGSAVTIDGFTLTGKVQGGNTFIGGLVGLADVSEIIIKNVTTGGQVVATAGIGGGFIGRIVDAKVTIQDSTFSGTVNGGTKLGGFIGQIQNSTANASTTTIKNATFSGTVTATGTSESTVAGFVANVNKTGNGGVTLNIQDSVTQGTVVAPGPYAAGAVAQVMNVSGITLSIDGVIATTDIQCASSNAGGIIARLMGTSIDATVKNCLAKVTFSTDSWCTAQIIGHAQNNAVKMENNFFVRTANSYTDGIESSGGNVTNPAQSVSEALWNYLKSCHEMGIKPDYDGFVDSGYQIADAADLYGFNVYNEHKGLSGKTVKLTADITINTLGEDEKVEDWATKAPKYSWMPVGAITGSGTFAGTFDGQGHTISGLYCAYAGGNSLGMFREVTGTVTNFKLVDSYLANTAEADYGYNGGIVAYLNGGTVSKVYTNAIIETVDSYAGGIVGFTGGTTATISECQFDGVLNARCYLDKACDATDGDQSRGHANHVGGITGAITATNNNVSDCIFSGKIINTCNKAHRTGGIIGGAPAAGKNATILRCFSIGEFRSDANSYHFSMIMDLRQGSSNTTLTNLETVFADNYVLTQKLYNLDGSATLNSDGNLTGCNKNSGITVPSTTRYTEAEMIAKIAADKEADTSNLDFDNVWVYEEGKLPTLKAFATND